ncbi:MAG: transposase, partial [Methylomonas sp.]
ERHIDYIHYNPVKHQYVSNVHDWPYSSFHSYVARGIYPENWGGSLNFVVGGGDN